MTVAINRYADYGIPDAANMGRFQYTGQTWMPDLAMYNDKARVYSPTLGRFMQTDPIGYGDGLNMYAYVGNDPVNGVDPTGMCVGNGMTVRNPGDCLPPDPSEMVVTGSKYVRGIRSLSIQSGSVDVSELDVSLGDIGGGDSENVQESTENNKDIYKSAMWRLGDALSKAGVSAQLISPFAATSQKIAIRGPRGNIAALAAFELSLVVGATIELNGNFIKWFAGDEAGGKSASRDLSMGAISKITPVSSLAEALLSLSANQLLPKPSGSCDPLND